MWVKIYCLSWFIVESSLFCQQCLHSIKNYISITAMLIKFHCVKFVSLTSNFLRSFINDLNNYLFYRKIWFKFSKISFLFFRVKEIAANHKMISNVFWFEFHSLKKSFVFIDYAFSVSLKHFIFRKWSIHWWNWSMNAAVKLLCKNDLCA